MFYSLSLSSGRRRIATKVMAKKVSKGYLLLEESCKFCDMPLMEGKGRKECKVCPAIKKWMNKHAPNADENLDGVILCNSEASIDITHQLGISNISDVEKFDERLEDDEHTETDELEHSVALDQTIIDNMSKVTRDVVRFVNTKREGGTLSLSPIPETLEVSGSGNTSNLDNKSQEAEQTANELMIAREKKAIEDRATQIIMEARNRGGWNTSYARINTVVDDTAFYQGVAEARAELIIMKARETLKRKGHGPSAPLTPMTQLRNKHVSTACRICAVISKLPCNLFGLFLLAACMAFACNIQNEVLGCRNYSSVLRPHGACEISIY